MKGYRDNGSAASGFGARNKTVYDDVFGGPPKFGATTLPPRLEDYTEIFQGFHASRGSSIPVLDLPPPSNESDDVWFDVQSSKLDYSEVFGGFKGLDFAISYEELFNISKVGDGDSSDDLWTPAQSETLSDELDPYTSMEMNQQVSTTDPIEIFSEQLQNEPTFEAEKDVSNGIIYDSEFFDDPSEKENEKSFSLANNDHSSSNHGVVEGKQLQKSLSEPLDTVYKQHFSVCDLSLKTQPSNLPPPSRPPPVLSSKGDMDTFCLNPKLKTSKSYAFENMRGDRSPPYFDVEIDASSSSAAADAAAMKDAVEQAQAKLRSAKESMDRKKESLQNRSKITKGPIEKDRKHELIDENQQMKMKDVVKSEPENTCSPSQQIKTAIEVDESESYDNLIEIELKDNDMEPVVNKNEVKDDNDSFEKEDEKELKESKAGPPEILIVTQNEKEEDDEEHEKVVEDCYNWEENESDKISETASEKEQTLSHKEKISQKEDDQEALKHTLNEKTETIHQTESTSSSSSSSSSSEDTKLQKDHEREESEEEISDASVNNDNEILQNDLQDVKIEVPIENDNHGDKRTNIERKGVNDKLLREREKENERIRKQEEERERQIEREKDRMERAFSETTKEKERAAVERATAEYKQRALAEARDRLEKACAEARERSLAEKTMEGRMRVEKATAEARERAERSVMGGIRYPYNNNGGESESPQRCKARLERHQRTADRAAKALAEKNMRDLLAQKEQTERNRLAEGLDAEVKRWCGGKQGNLRALLSTLQYILGPESGWQPIPLTEVITTVAVKKAYRKATLCVHPDKLQQRGATIHQKYICEKVFDLLKEAWNKFNSEER